jgi:PhnB protein
MANEVKPIPDGCEGAAPYLCVNGAAAAIEFYKKAFGAIEVYRLTEPSGKIGHAEIRIGRAVIMLADEYLEYGHRSPHSLGGTPVKIHLYFKDADAVVSQAYDAGAKILQPVKDEFYGDRGGKLEDPFGHVWLIATRKEDVPPEEIRKRFAAFFEQPAQA